MFDKAVAVGKDVKAILLSIDEAYSFDDDETKAAIEAIKDKLAKAGINAEVIILDGLKVELVLG